MHYLLVVMIVGSYSEALTTEVFADEKSCIAAGKNVTTWVNNNNGRWQDSSNFKCFYVSGDK